MKILMSAFSCGPDHGSEPGLGWNMALEAARLGHEVHVLTQTEYGAEIRRAVAAGRTPANLTFDIYMPRWLEALRDAGLRLGLFTLTWQSVNVLWQFCALARARRLYRNAGFDLVHHVTLAGVRHPTLLGLLGLPLALGPLGGGESAPPQLRRSMPLKDRLVEMLRDAHTRAMRLDPMTRSAFRGAFVIFLRSPECLRAVPPRDRGKALFSIGLGIAEASVSPGAKRAAGDPLRLLYAGRLVWWKGGHLALRALARARAQGADATLTMIGEGPAQRAFEALAARLGVSGQVEMRGELLHAEAMRLFGASHALLFPSLHDSASTVTLEAFAHGLPVICLALGGPGVMVTPDCGFAVPALDRSEEQCVEALAAAILTLAQDEPLRQRLAEGARTRCAAHRWAKVAGEIYARIGERVKQARRRQEEFSLPADAGKAR